MKSALKLILSFLFVTVLVGLNQATAQNMYRGTADHHYNYNSGIKGYFNEKAWKFYADAPIRSTGLAVGNSVYFGSSRGIFYCLDKYTGNVRWMFRAAQAINSSAAMLNGDVYFSDNKQSLYAVNAATGKLTWKISLGPAKNYDWAFDYTYSSPVIAGSDIIIGSKDGNIYSISTSNRKVNWKFKTEGVVRSAPAVSDGVVYAGDTEGNFFAIDLHSGKQKWRFALEGHALDNTKFGFDRRAVIAAPIIVGDKVLIGGRDGFGYCLDKNSGKQLWRIDHQVSWIISAMAVKGNIVVTGTSDGHFVQGIDLNSGKQLWKFHTANVVWSSPIIDGDNVYIGSHEGMLYCLDLQTGMKLTGFQTGGIIFSSPVIDRQTLYVGSDDGYLYALRSGTGNKAPQSARKYVFWDESIPSSNAGNDNRIKRFLNQNDYITLSREKLISVMSKKDSATNTVIVFATNYFPEEITKGEKNSALRGYLDAGGKVVVTGNDPLILRYDTTYKSVVIRNFLYADSVIGIKYGPDDLRSFKGNQPAFVTKAGAIWGMKSFWASPLSIDPKQVDVILGLDENGLASAWVKKFNKAEGSGFVQIWAGDSDRDLSFIMRVAEFGLR